MKNYIKIILIATLLILSPITFAEETTELREAKIDLTYTPQKDSTILKIKIENTGKMVLEAMTLKIFCDNELSESDPVSIGLGESKTFEYTIPKETSVVEAFLSRGGLGIKFSKSTIKPAAQELSTIVHFSEGFFSGRGDIYNLEFDFEMAGRPLVIEQGGKGIVVLKLKNTGTVDIDLDIEAESQLKLDYPEDISLKADKAKDVDIVVFAGDKIGSYKVHVTGKTEHITKTLPIPVEINVVEKPPANPIIEIIEIIHKDHIYLEEETKVVVRMKNIGLGEEIDIKLDVPEGWEVLPLVEKRTIKRFETVNVEFYIVPKTSGKEKIRAQTGYGTLESEIQVGRSLLSYVLTLLSFLILILILILSYEVYKLSKAEYEFRKDYAIAIIILLIILYITSWKSFTLFLWVLAFLVAVPILIYSYYRRKKAKEKGGLKYVCVK